MKTSIAMSEIRDIRDANSLRHLTMDNEAIFAELKMSVEWFLSEVNKIKTIKKTVGAFTQNLR